MGVCLLLGYVTVGFTLVVVLVPLLVTLHARYTKLVVEIIILIYYISAILIIFDVLHLLCYISFVDSY